MPMTSPNPHHILGVFFDSDTYGFQPDEVQTGTKITALLGGHFWNNLETMPGEEECVRAAAAAVGSHLGISPARITSGEEGCLVHSHLNPSCIPQYNLNHSSLLSQTHSALQRQFNSRLLLAGGSYTSVGVMPSLRAGYEAALQVSRRANLDHVGETGLAIFAKGGRGLDVTEVDRRELNALGKQVRELDLVQRYLMHV